MENHHEINRQTIYKRAIYSMAMLNNQRVYSTNVEQHHSLSLSTYMYSVFFIHTRTFKSIV